MCSFFSNSRRQSVKSIFDHDLIFIPINEKLVFRLIIFSFHWFLAVIDNPRGCISNGLTNCTAESMNEANKDEVLEDVTKIYIIDSLGSKYKHRTIRLLKKYFIYLLSTSLLLLESISKNQLTDKNKILGRHLQVPCQKNYVDCGVFLLHYVEKILQNPPEFRQRAQGEKDSLANWFDPSEISDKRKMLRNTFKALSSLSEDTLLDSIPNKSSSKFDEDEECIQITGF